MQFFWTAGTALDVPVVLIPGLHWKYAMLVSMAPLFLVIAMLVFVSIAGSSNLSFFSPMEVPDLAEVLPVLFYSGAAAASSSPPINCAFILCSLFHVSVRDFLFQSPEIEQLGEFNKVERVWEFLRLKDQRWTDCSENKKVVRCCKKFLERKYFMDMAMRQEVLPQEVLLSLVWVSTT